MHITRRSLIAGALGGAAASSFPAPLLARAPKAGSQAPGFFRCTVGSIEVTALADGALPIATDLFTGGTPSAAEVLGAKSVSTSVNAWVVNTGERLVLLDTGASSALGDALGHLTANLQAAGYTPDQVDAVVLTHLHVDHAYGLLKDGAPAFPNAQLYLSEAELGFWTDDAILAQAPEEAKPHFKFARDASKPYADAGKIVTFKTGEVLPGLHAEAASGHTPGHTMFRLSSGDRQVLFWGDIVHNAGLQIPEPDRAVAFDTDQNAAIATRKKVLDMVATDGIEVAGAHIAFPGMGQVVRTPAGHRFIARPWSA